MFFKERLKSSFKRKCYMIYLWSLSRLLGRYLTAVSDMLPNSRHKWVIVQDSFWSPGLYQTSDQASPLPAASERVPTDAPPAPHTHKEYITGSVKQQAFFPGAKWPTELWAMPRTLVKDLCSLVNGFCLIPSSQWTSLLPTNPFLQSLSIKA